MAAERMPVVKFTQEQFKAKAIELYGDNPMDWKFRCPVCKIETTVRELKEAGAPQGAIGYSCIGRYVKSSGNIGNEKQPCDYTMGGLLRFPEMYVDGNPYFALAGM